MEKCIINGDIIMCDPDPLVFSLLNSFMQGGMRCKCIIIVVFW